MAQFNHPNIVALTGVCTVPAEEPTLIVLPYMHLGSLQGYLQNPMVKDQLETLTLVRMALDVGAGMQYLAESGFVVSGFYFFSHHESLSLSFSLCTYTHTYTYIFYIISICIPPPQPNPKPPRHHPQYLNVHVPC